VDFARLPYDLESRKDLLFAAKVVGAQFGAHLGNYRHYSVAVAHACPRARMPAETLTQSPLVARRNKWCRCPSLRFASRGSPVRSRSRPPTFSFVLGPSQACIYTSPAGMCDGTSTLSKNEHHLPRARGNFGGYEPLAKHICDLWS
jgi:hypothetical protein